MGQNFISNGRGGRTIPAGETAGTFDRGSEIINDMSWGGGRSSETETPIANKRDLFREGVTGRKPKTAGRKSRSADRDVTYSARLDSPNQKRRKALPGEDAADAGS